MSIAGRIFAARVRDAAAWCLDNPKKTALFALAAMAVTLLGGLTVEVDPSPEAYLEGTEEWAFYERINREYQIGEPVVIAFRESGGTVFDVETVSAVAELGRSLSQHPEVERVLSVATASTLDREGDSLDLRPLLRSRPVTKDDAMALGERVREHPFFGSLLVDERHESTFLFVQLTPSMDDPVKRLDTVRAIRAEADRFRSAHRTVHLGGTAVTKEAVAAGIQKDTMLFFPAALALLAVLLWVMFGDWVASAIPIVVVSFSSAVVAGALALAGAELNMATATVPTIILVVGLADSVHFLAELRRQYARTGAREASLLATVEAIALPCLLTTATSAVGFLALVTSRVGPLRQFGYATAVGLVAAYAASMLLTPLLLSAFRYPRERSNLFPAAPKLGRYMGRFAGLAHRHLTVTLALTGLLFGVCFAAVSRIDLDSDFVRYMDEDHRLRRDLEVIERTLGGADIVEVIVDGPDPGYFARPKGLRALDELVEDLGQLDGVTGIVSLSSYLRLAKAVMENRPLEADSPLPASESEVAQLRLIDPTTFSYLGNDDLSQVRLTLQIRPMSSEQILELEEVAEQTAALNPAGEDLEATFTGLPSLFARIVHNLVEDAYGSFGIAALLIFVAMLVGLRSPALAFVTMVPNVLTVGLTFGTMSALGLSFDTNSAFVACLGIGIAVDDTIHIAARYQRARSEGSPTPIAAVQYAVTHAGHPVVLTSVLLVVGFSVLCLSSFAPTFRVGLLSAILVTYAVVLDLALLPVLLVTADRIERRFEDEVRPSPACRAGLRQVFGVLTTPPAARPEEPEEPPRKTGS